MASECNIIMSIFFLKEYNHVHIERQSPMLKFIHVTVYGYVLNGNIVSNSIFFILHNKN